MRLYQTLRIMPFYPGPGVGGHCIPPVDPHYLEWKARSIILAPDLSGWPGGDQQADARVCAREGSAGAQ